MTVPLVLVPRHEALVQQGMIEKCFRKFCKEDSLSKNCILGHYFNWDIQSDKDELFHDGKSKVEFLIGQQCPPGISVVLGMDMLHFKCIV